MYYAMNKKLMSSVIRFLVVGGISTLFNYAVFFFLTKVLLVNYLWASVAGYISGLILGFFLNHFWTFESRGYNPKTIVGYCMVYLLSLGLSTFFLWVAVGKFHLNKYFMNIIAIGITTVLNFIGLKTIIYKNEPEEVK